MGSARHLRLSTSEISDVTASMPSLGYFALQHRVAPPRKAYSLTSSAFIAFGALYPFSLFKPVFRGSLIIKKGLQLCNPFFICDSFREAEHINSEFRIPNSEFISPVSSEFARGASNVLSENTAEIVRIAEAAPHCYLSNR